MGGGDGPDRDRTVRAYRDFAERWAARESPLYQRLAAGVADDPEMVDFLLGRPIRERQPNLLLAAVRWRWGLVDSYQAFRALVLGHRDEVAEIMSARRTQTNEPARCATLLPVLSALPQPLALLEVGAAAGLCLLPDRYAYRYVDEATGRSHEVGDGGPLFECRVRGAVPLPERLPEIAWRRGIDLDPVDLGDEDRIRWLETLIWPGPHRRAERLRAAIEVARADPPEVVRGDLLELLPAVAAQAPAEATLVVFHSAVLVYLSRDDRGRFRELVAALPGHWLANEGAGIVSAGPPRREADGFVLTVDGRADVALTDGHGAWLEWV